MTARFRWHVPIAAAAMLVVSGCGGGGTNPPATGGAPPTTAKNETTAATSKVGTIAVAPAADDEKSIAALVAAGAHIDRDEQNRALAVLFPADVSDESLGALRGLPNLRRVSLAEAKMITDDGLAVFGDLKSVESIDLSWTAISGTGLAHLASAEGLESLDVSYTAVTDEHLLPLRKLKRLRQLNVEMTAITQQGREALRAENNELAFNVSPGKPTDPYAKEEKAKNNADTPEGKYDAIIAAQEKAMARLQRAMNAATTREAQEAAIEAFEGDTLFAKQMIELANAQPDDPVAIRALGWVMQATGKGDIESLKEQAADQLIASHLNNTELQESLMRLDVSTSTAAQKLLVALADKADDVGTRVRAGMSLAAGIKRTADMAQQVRNLSESQIESVKKQMGVEFVAFLLNAEGPALLEQAGGVLEKVVASSEGVEGLDEVLKAARSQLFVLRNLAIGATAPEIQGEDIDGNGLKLSDFRGRVVVLDFWGHW